jgi:hypothetical protein
MIWFQPQVGKTLPSFGRFSCDIYRAPAQKVLPGSLSDLSAWVESCTSSWAHRGVNIVLLAQTSSQWKDVVIRRVPLVEHDIFRLPEDMSSLPVYSGVRVIRSLVFCVVFCRFFLVLFLFAIVLSVLVRLTILIGSELMCSGSLKISCSTGGTRRLTTSFHWLEVWVNTTM